MNCPPKQTEVWLRYLPEPRERPGLHFVFTNGKVFLESVDNHLRISNTGNALRADPERLFERFKKESAGADSLGLGLAIVRQICDNYNLGIEYTYQDTIHSLLITRKAKDANGVPY